MNRLFILVLLALCQPSAFAAVYKCEGQGGKVVYQGTPCHNGSPLAIKPAPVAPAATPQTPGMAATNAPKTSAAAPAREKVCVGKELRINFKNMPVMTTLHVIADFSGNRLEADASITGGGPFYYDCVPWDLVLQDISGKYNLSAKVAGGVIVVTKR